MHALGELMPSTKREEPPSQPLYDGVSPSAAGCSRWDAAQRTRRRHRTWQRAASVRHVQEAIARRTSGDELVGVDIIAGTDAGATGTHLSYERLHITGPGPHDFEEVASLELDIPPRDVQHARAWPLAAARRRRVRPRTRRSGVGRQSASVGTAHPAAVRPGKRLDRTAGGTGHWQQAPANGSIFGFAVGAGAPQATSFGEVFREHSVRVTTRTPGGECRGSGSGPRSRPHHERRPDYAEAQPGHRVATPGLYSAWA